MSARDLDGLHTAIVCVDYADLLRLTLPHAVTAVRPVGGRITVLTAPWDEETQRCAQGLGVTTLVTSIWKAGRAAFNKAGGLNEWLDSLQGRGAGWRLSLDADIALPADCFEHAGPLDRSMLYGVPRRMCERQQDWDELAAGERALDSFSVDELPIRGGKIWGRLPTTNPAGLCGYFQLWHGDDTANDRRFPPSRSAGGYDVRFATTFPPSQRAFLHHRPVLHIGPERRNWYGRQTERWTHAKPCSPAMLLGRAPDSVEI